MTPQEILEGNKIIASYLSMNNPDFKVQYRGFRSSLGASLLTFFKRPSEMTDTEWERSLLYFHKDWSWLMPAVERLESLPQTTFTIIGTKCRVAKFRDNDPCIADYMKLHESDSKKQSIWLAVVDFIKWYNANLPA